MGLIEDIGAGPVALDTVPFIYYIEEHRDYLRVVEPLFLAVHEGAVQASTSVVTLIEVLIVPLRKGRGDLADAYEALLTGSRNLRLVEIDPPVARGAASLRAATGLPTPDCLQLSAAVACRSAAFVTNDRRLPPVPGLSILTLADYL